RIPLRIDDAGQAIKDPTFSAQMSRADALVVVSPEYNHGYSGLLKHALDSCLEEYIHKAVGVVGVSAGPYGGTRGIQDLLPVLRGMIEARHTCPGCGAGASGRAAPAAPARRQ